MSLYNIREIVTQEDMNQFIDLWCERSKRMKTPVEDQMASFKKSMFSGIPIGAFDKDGCLVGAMKYKKFKQLPYMFLYNVHIKKGLLKTYDFSDPANPIVPIIDHILKICEENQIYTWYHIRAITKGEHKLHKEGKDFFRQSNMCFDKTLNEPRYERFIEEIILSGQQSKHDSFKIALGGNVWKPNIALFKCVLKNKFRIDGDLLENELNYCLIDKAIN
jgi:hypothetical protein